MIGNDKLSSRVDEDDMLRSSRMVGNGKLPSGVGEDDIDDSWVRRGLLFWAARSHHRDW
jgi:hypothetical protein